MVYFAKTFMISHDTSFFIDHNVANFIANVRWKLPLADYASTCQGFLAFIFGVISDLKRPNSAQVFYTIS